MNNYEWPKRIVHWTDDDTAYISVVFTWLLPEAYPLAVSYQRQGFRVKAGGPAVGLMPWYLAQVAEVNGDIEALPRHNPEATFTSRGCIRNCPPCAVPWIEGPLTELPHFEPNRVVCDNNILACSKKHFDRVIDSLMPVHGIDFNQGLDARLFELPHLDRFRDLDLAVIRFAWDDVQLETIVINAVRSLINAGFPRSKLRVYVLINYNDTPDDATYRCNTLKQLGIFPNVQRYQPLTTLVKDSYISPNWTAPILDKFVRYWNRQIYFKNVPYNEFSNSIRHRRNKIGSAEGQLTMVFEQ